MNPTERPMSHSRAQAKANTEFAMANSGLIPHESTTRREPQRLSGIRGRVTTLLVAGPAAIFGTGAVLAQTEPSPAPTPGQSLNPEQSLIPGASPTDILTAENPCPPGQRPVEPSPTPSPEASPTPVLAVGPDQEVALIGDSSRVIVTFPPNQEAPSTAPSAPASPDASGAPVSQDPKTGSGDGSVKPKALTEQECEWIELSGREFVELTMNQKLGEDGTIKKVAYDEIAESINLLWATNKEILSTIEIPNFDGEKFSKEIITWYLDRARNGNPNENLKGYKLKAEKASYAATFAVLLAGAADKITDPYLKRDLYAAVDSFYDYGVHLDPSKNLERSKKYMDGEMRASADYYLPAPIA